MNLGKTRKKNYASSQKQVMKAAKNEQKSRKTLREENPFKKSSYFNQLFCVHLYSLSRHISRSRCPPFFSFPTNFFIRVCFNDELWTLSIHVGSKNKIVLRGTLSTESTHKKTFTSVKWIVIYPKTLLVDFLIFFSADFLPILHFTVGAK